MRTDHFCAASNGAIIGDRPGSERSSYIQVTAIPEHVKPSDVRRALSRIMIWPWPSQPVQWGRIADLPIGTIVRDLA